MPRPVHFELHADDPQRAVTFYRTLFGWGAQQWEGPQEYHLLTTGEQGTPGIDGAILRRTAPGTSTVNTIDVPSVDEYVAKAVAAGGQVAMPKMAVPGIGWLAYCMDTEGNVFGLMQMDAGAA